MMRWLAILVLWWPLVAWADPTVDAVTGPAGGQAAALSFSHSIASDANLLIVCTSECCSSGTEGTTSVTVGGQNLTFLQEIRNTSGDLHGEMWYKLAPPTGSQTIATAFDNGDGWISVVAISFKGVKQSAPTRLDTGDGTTNAPTNTTTSAVGNLALDCLSQAGGGVTPATPTFGGGQTQRWAFHHDNALGSYGSTKAGASPNVTLSETLDDIYFWAKLDVSLEPIETRRRIGVLRLK